MTLPIPEKLSETAGGLKEEKEELFTPTGHLAKPNVEPDVRPYVTVVSEDQPIIPGAGEIALGARLAGDAIPVVSQPTKTTKPQLTQAESWYEPFTRKDKRRKERLAKAA